MNESKEKFINITVKDDGKVKIEVNHLSPLDVISICNVTIGKALLQIEIKQKSESNIAKPNTAEAVNILNNTRN